MEQTQSLTKTDDDIDHEAIRSQMYQLSPTQQVWIDYKALGGIIYDNETDQFRKMPVREIAQKLNVSRETLYAWRHQIPGFWDHVAKRRQELNAGEYLSRIHEKWKLKALTFDNWPMTEAWLRNFDPSYRESRMKVEHEAAGSLLDVLEKARNTRVVIEGDVVDATDNKAIKP